MESKKKSKKMKKKRSSSSSIDSSRSSSSFSDKSEKKKKRSKQIKKNKKRRHRSKGKEREKEKIMHSSSTSKSSSKHRKKKKEKKRSRSRKKSNKRELSEAEIMRKRQIRLAKARALKFENEDKNNKYKEDEIETYKEVIEEKEEKYNYKNENDWFEADEDNENNDQVILNPHENENKEPEEDDELDKFMQSISQNVVKQETVSLYYEKNHTYFKDPEKIWNEESYKIEEEVINPSQIITFDEIFKGKIENEDNEIENEENKEIETEKEKKIKKNNEHFQNENEEGEEEEEEEEEDKNFHQAFIEAMKNKKEEDVKKKVINSKNLKQKQNGDNDIKLENLIENDVIKEIFKLNDSEKNEGLNLTKEKNDKNEKRTKRQIFDSDDEDEYANEEMKNCEDEDYFAIQKRLAEKKELKVTDHAQITYEGFRKNFYIESKEISDMTIEEVQFFRKELGDMKVRGKDCPKPIKNWYQCGLSNKILHVLIDKRKYTTPFPIQNQALPAIMSGRDVIGIAETGSGKTLAYVLPMLRHILDQPSLQEGDGPIAIVLAPTRELATQIYYECKAFAKILGLNTVCVYGGTGVAGQLSDLKRGTEIVVCTPGRMIDVLCTSNGKITNLKRITYIVLDEADRMFDLGFEPQISRIIGNVRPDRQTVMFSATFPKNVENLAKKILNRPIEIVIGNRGQVCSNVEQIVEVREESSKFLRLLELLGEWNESGNILIFVDKKSEADELFKELLKYGYLPLVLHGGQDQTDREYTIIDFKKGIRNIMVATSICARGLDIKSLVLVINFNCPNHLEDYIHRIGRTGRAGNRGTAITFIVPEEESFAPELVKVMQISNCKPSISLLELCENFKKKVETGDAKIYTNKNLAGTGYKFDKEESMKVKHARDAMRKFFESDIEDLSDDLDDDKITKRDHKPVEEKTEMSEKKLQKKYMELIKDPSTKASVMSAATKAAKDAIMVGASSEEVLQAAQNAIKSILSQYKPTAHSVEKGLENAIKLRDEILAREEENSEFIIAELEINDYPMNARQKVINKEFLLMIHELTNCNITLRGTYAEPGKKVPLGQKKLFLHIEGESKYNVGNAYREIKRILEEHAMQSLAMGPAPGKYKI